MLIINTLEEFSNFIFENIPMARDLIHHQACDNEEFGNMSAKDAYQSACDEFIEMYVDPNEVQINLDKQTCSNWLWEHAS
jgi:hypothetical protein